MLKAVTNLVNVSQITGVLPVVNGGTGVTTSTGTGNVVLSAAPTLSGNVTLSTGNLIVASGQGIDFSATSSGSGTMTSELLADYEEGTWTPTLTTNGFSGAVTLTSATGLYTKVGRQVTVQCYLILSGFAYQLSFNLIAGLPFSAGSNAGSYMTAHGNRGGACGVGGTNLFSYPNSDVTTSTQWFFTATYSV